MSAERTSAKEALTPARVEVAVTLRVFAFAAPMFAVPIVEEALVVVLKVEEPTTLSNPASVRFGTLSDATLSVVMFAVPMVEEATVEVARVEVPRTL